MDGLTNIPATQILHEKNWLPANTKIVETSIAGAGNMNLVERIKLDNGSSVILKRARSWVEKYPDIPAPIERAKVEADFYAAVAGTAAGQAMPKHLAYDHAYAASLIEDLGEGTDGSYVYENNKLPRDDLKAVADWTAALHAVPVSDEMRLSLANQSMRELNALHIFDFPLDPNNGFDLDQITPGLQAAGDALKTDTAFVNAVKKLGERYLSQERIDTHVLLHGDLYPGSWLTADEKLFVIDPEFCWIGPAEWDVGVLLAHLRLSNQPRECERVFIESYSRPLDISLVNAIKGVEIMRRLIGVAQLPLDIDLAAKTKMLDEARDLIPG